MKQKEKNSGKTRFARDKDVLSKLVPLKVCLCPLNKVPFTLKILDPSDMEDGAEATLLSQMETAAAERPARLVQAEVAWPW